MNQSTETQDQQSDVELDLSADVVEQLNDANNRVRQSLVGVPTHVGVTVLLDIVGGAITNPNLPEAARIEGAKYFSTIAGSAAQAVGVELPELLKVIETAYHAQAAQDAAHAAAVAEAQQQAEGQVQQ